MIKVPQVDQVGLHEAEGGKGWQSGVGMCGTGQECESNRRTMAETVNITEDTGTRENLEAFATYTVNCSLAEARMLF